MKYFLFFLIFLPIFGCASKEKKEATLIIKDGTVYLPDGSTSITDIIIRDSLIVDIGSNKASEYKTVRLINAEEEFVMPGLIDAHAHFLGIGNTLNNVNLLGITTWKETVATLQEKVDVTPEGTWIVGRGWHQDKWTDKPSKTVDGYPTHHDLSKISPNHPIMLSHASGHGILVNQKAMELAGISSNTLSPAGGKIIVDEEGQPIGVFQENAEQLISKIYYQSTSNQTEEQKKEAFSTLVKLATKECLRNGITTLHDAGVSATTASQFQELANENQLHVRIFAMLSDATVRNATSEELEGFVRYNNSFYQTKAVKAFMDGALGSRGAWLLEPYSDQPNYYGENVTPIDTLLKTAIIAKQNGMQLCIHAIGDRGNREALTVFQSTMGDDLASARWRIEHAQHLNPKDIERLGALNVIASMQTVHCTSDAPYVEKRLGAERAEQGAYVWQRLLTEGVHIANGTDSPVERLNPFENIYAAITRKPANSEVAFYPNQSLTRKQALDSYTIWNAYAAFQEDQKGSIEIGKLADIVLLNKNLLTCDEAEIPDTKVVTTIVNGKIAYQKE